MRLWSIHPKYLDAKGLTACWREALLAKAVLNGRTRGYKNHPQLARFDRRSINTYLAHILAEAQKRGYSFDARKIGKLQRKKAIRVTRGQLTYEFDHLRKKLRVRDPKKYREIVREPEIAAHPSFRVVPGSVEKWEKRQTSNIIAE